MAGRSIGTVAARPLGGFLTLLDRTRTSTVSPDRPARLLSADTGTLDETNRGARSIPSAASGSASAPTGAQTRCADMGLPISGGNSLGEPHPGDG